MSIRVAALTKAYGALTVVPRFDIEVIQGEMLVLLGPSGCGKTTIMRCIAGLETPMNGSIHIGGVPVFDAAAGINVPVHKRNVGMVFQSYAIWPHMTVFQNVAFPLKMAKVANREIQERVGEMLHTVGLSDFAQRGASFLSGGQMQRVALARSLVMQPAVLLLDEPMSNLDARLREKLRIELRELQTRLKITSVFVTHDQQEALALADKVAVLEKGHLLQEDNPTELYRNPNSKIVADFLGYSNIFAVELVAESSTSAIRTIGAGTVLNGKQALLPGGPMFAAVRPTAITIQPAADETTRACEGVFGTVSLVSFEGSLVTYIVDVNGEQWRVANSVVPAVASAGDRVRLTFSPADLLIVPER